MQPEEGISLLGSRGSARRHVYAPGTHRYHLCRRLRVSTLSKVSRCPGGRLTYGNDFSDAVKELYQLWKSRLENALESLRLMRHGTYMGS